MRPLLPALCLLLSLSLSAPSAACLNEAPEAVPEHISADVNLHGVQAQVPSYRSVDKYDFEEGIGFEIIYETAAQHDMKDLPVGTLLENFVYNGIPAEYKQSQVDERLEKANATPSWANKNNLAVAMIRNSQAKEAVALLVALDKEFPGHYETAANLGTAYELSGDDENALVWITEGITRNPKSHRGSEWLHIKILEAKIAEKKTPGWLTTHSASGADFGSAPLPSLRPTLPRGNLGQSMTVAEFRDAIEYQVSERIQFVKAPNDIVGDLLFDFANASAITEGPKVAILTLRVAKPYGAPKAKLLDQRIKALQDYGMANPPQSPPYHLATFLFLGLSFTVCGLWIKVSQTIRSAPPGPLPVFTRLWGFWGFFSAAASLTAAALVPFLMKGFVGEPSKTMLLISAALLFVGHLWGRALSGQRLWTSVFPIALVLLAALMDVYDAMGILLFLLPIGVVYWGSPRGLLKERLPAERIAAQEEHQEKASSPTLGK